MPASIFGNRFLSHREPAWHNLGLVVEEDVSAWEAYRRMGPYEVELRPLWTPGSNGQPLEVPLRAVVRKATDGLPDEFFGVAGKDYHLITPEQTVKVWDGALSLPVETIGALQNGETLFITTKLPSIDVRGDEVWMYLLVVAPFQPGQALEIRITAVRVVCQNTLMAAKRATSELYRIIHDQHVAERYGKWLAEAYQRTAVKAEALAESFELLANHRIWGEDRNYILEAAYPDPSRPRENATAEVMNQRMEWFEGALENVQRMRSAVTELFEGAGAGMGVEACAGTAWGLYNAVAECENYRRGRGDASVAKNVLFGNRGEIEERAFTAALEVCRN